MDHNIKDSLFHFGASFLCFNTINRECWISSQLQKRNQSQLLTQNDYDSHDINYLRFETKCLYIGSVLQYCHDPSDIPTTLPPTSTLTTSPKPNSVSIPEKPEESPPPTKEPKRVEFSEKPSSFNKMLTKPQCKGRVLRISPNPRSFQ